MGISLCTVAHPECAKIFDNLIYTVSCRLKLVDEIVICKTADFQLPLACRTDVRCVEFLYRGPDYRRLGTNVPSTEHAFCLKACIDKAKNDLVLLSDPDLFYYMPADVFYCELMEKYGLHYVGASNASPQSVAPQYFPNPINLLADRKDFPDESFLRDDLPVPGQYLTPLRINRLEGEYPLPGGIYDTSCLLYLWAKQQNLKWLAFQAEDMHLYLTKYYKCSDRKLRLALPVQKLLWHASCFTMNQDWFGRLYDEEFAKAKAQLGGEEA